MVKLQPFGDKVVIEVIATEEKLGSLLYQPQDVSKSNKGIVVAVGEGTLSNGTLIPLSIKVNDKVIFQLGVGLNYIDGNKTYKVLSARDILCKIIEE